MELKNNQLFGDLVFFGSPYSKVRYYLITRGPVSLKFTFPLKISASSLGILQLEILFYYPDLYVCMCIVQVSQSSLPS